MDKNIIKKLLKENKSLKKENKRLWNMLKDMAEIADDAMTELKEIADLCLENMNIKKEGA